MRVFGSLPGHKQTFQAKNNVSSSLTSGHSSRQRQLSFESHWHYDDFGEYTFGEHT
jgi:hypothetical protein